MKAGSAIEINDLEDYEETELQKYQRFIGKFMHLAYRTRPDIAFMVDQLSTHIANPRKGHLQATKRIVRYLKDIMKMGFVFRKEVNNHLSRDSPPYALIGYVDSNFAKDLVD